MPLYIILLKDGSYFDGVSTVIYYIGTDLEQTKEAFKDAKKFYSQFQHLMYSKEKHPDFWVDNDMKYGMDHNDPEAVIGDVTYLEIKEYVANTKLW